MTETRRPARVSALYRYPVKGLSPEPLERVPLTAGETAALRPRLCHRERTRPVRSRRAAAPAEDQLPDADARRAAGHAAARMFDDATETLTIFRDGKQVARGQLDDAARPPADRAVHRRLHEGGAARARPRSCMRPATASPTWPPSACTSSTWRACARSSACRAGRSTRCASAPISIIDGVAPWAEFGWLDKEISVGPARSRCSRARSAARPPTSIPATGARDMAIPAAPAAHLGHTRTSASMPRSSTGGEIGVGAPVARRCTTPSRR